MRKIRSTTFKDEIRKLKAAPEEEETFNSCTAFTGRPIRLVLGRGARSRPRYKEKGNPLEWPVLSAVQGCRQEGRTVERYWTPSQQWLRCVALRDSPTRLPCAYDDGVTVLRLPITRPLRLATHILGRDFDKGGAISMLGLTGSSVATKPPSPIRLVRCTYER